MIANVGFIKGIALLVVGDHVIQRRLNLRQIAGGGPLCRPAGYRRLHQITHFAHRRDEPRVFILFQRPLQYVAVEEIPLAARRDEGAAIAFHLNQALRLQRAKDFADDVAGGGKLLAQVSLRRQRRSGKIFAAHNLAAQGHHQPIGFSQVHSVSLTGLCPVTLLRSAHFHPVW